MEPLGWHVRLLRSFVYGLCAAAFAFPLGDTLTVLSTALGAALGAELGGHLAASRLRSVAVVGGAAVGGFVIASLLSIVGRSQAIANAVGPASLLHALDAIRWSVGALLASATMTTLVLRTRWVSFLEVAAGGMIFSQLVADHRHGAINRPFELADPILLRGGDPTGLFLALGAVAAVLLAAVLIRERRLGRLLVHALVLLVLVSVAWWTAERRGLVPRPDPSGSGLGLNKSPRGGKGGKGGKPDKPKQSERPSNDNLEFRDQQSSDNRQVPLAVVLLHDDYSPPTGTYYFRQEAFSQFNGRRLVRAVSGDVDRDVTGGFPLARVEVPDAPEAGDERATLDTTVALLADHGRPFGLEAPVAFEPASNPNPDRFRRVYRVTSAALTADFSTMVGLPSGHPDWSTEERNHYLMLPEDPRYQAMAEEIVEKIPAQVRDDPMVRAVAITRFLSEKGVYSLKSKHAGAEDPTAHFLFGDKTGYCVHFAHAATYLMRAAEVPARVATGYAIEESARQGGSAILVSSGAAHAWPEIYLDGAGWIVVDVQPQQTLDAPPQPPDPDLQRLLGMLARGAKPLPPNGEPPPSTMDELFAALWAYLGQGATWLLLAILVGLYGVKLWRFAAPHFADPRRLPRALYRAQLDRLAEAGRTRRTGESREAFARRLFEETPSFGALTDVHVGAAFGSSAASQLDSKELWSRARSAGAELRKAVPTWRRWLGMLAPWSWLQAR